MLSVTNELHAVRVVQCVCLKSLALVHYYIFIKNARYKTHSNSNIFIILVPDMEMCLCAHVQWKNKCKQKNANILKDDESFVQL